MSHTSRNPLRVNDWGGALKGGIIKSSLELTGLYREVANGAEEAVEGVNHLDAKAAVSQVRISVPISTKCVVLPRVRCIN
jgi:hypothetical protein